MSQTPRPTNIEVSNSAETLRIDWSDDHQSVYPLFGLRKNCPCVMCQGGHAKMGRYDRSIFFVEPTMHYQIQDIEQVGNHAIKIIWNDGHNTGMYRWKTLRELCPCKECYPKQA